MTTKNFVSWNVNGIRACTRKGFEESFATLNADIFCLQETKVQAGQYEIDLPGYTQYWHYAEKKGYSGTAVFSRETPLAVTNGIGMPEFDCEGRSITLEYEDFFFITVYTPNSQDALARIDYRMAWENAFRAYLKKLDDKKPVIFCGDLNVAHNEIDLKNPKTNHKSAGFSDQERGKLDELLDAGYTDTFRHFYPELAHAYSWWSYRANARANNSGWRIDYFMTSDRLKEKLVDAKIHPDIIGSDHCPVSLTIEI
jgi:exodeoxyribonuclease-3